MMKIMMSSSRMIAANTSRAIPHPGTQLLPPPPPPPPPAAGLACELESVPGVGFAEGLVLLFFPLGLLVTKGKVLIVVVLAP